MVLHLLEEAQVALSGQTIVNALEERSLLDEALEPGLLAVVWAMAAEGWLKRTRTGSRFSPRARFYGLYEITGEGRRQLAAAENVWGDFQRALS